MDPNASRAEMIRLAQELQYKIDHDETVDDADVSRLAELVLALDVWITHRGFLPKAWDHKGGKL